MRRRGGNDSSIPVSRWVVPASVPETPPTTVTFKNSSLLGRQSDTASLGENRGSPPKTVSRCRLHNLSFYFIFNIFFQFNYLVTLINRYDCSACNLCARHLICSGSGRGGGLLWVLFFLFHDGRRFRSTAADLIILSQRGIRDEAYVACFALDYLTFSVVEADLLKS